MKTPRTTQWDVFICHASEDKDEVARPLAELMEGRGFTAWYDEFSLRMGDSLRRAIERGLSRCRFGIVVLSKDFFAKEWPQRELDALVEREVRTKRKIILPVWHRVDYSQVAKFSPLLADRKAVSTTEGLEKVVNAIIDAIGTRKRRGPQPLQTESDTPADDTFKQSFSSKLGNLTGLLESKAASPTAVSDLIEELIMLCKERIDKWDVSSMKFATRELFTRLYKFSEDGLCELYMIYKDLFAHAYKQRKTLLDYSIGVLNSIMLEAWSPDHDLEKAEKASKVLLRLAIDFIKVDPSITRSCAIAIDNLAGDMFEPEILSKQIILAAHVCATGTHDEWEALTNELTDWIRTNDQYAWDARIKTYLIDSIGHAQAEGVDYGVDVNSFSEKFLIPAVQENIDQQIASYVDFLDEMQAKGEEDIEYASDELIAMLVAYESARPAIADEIRRRVLETKEQSTQRLFDRIVGSSQILGKIYRGSEMITTFDELMKFIDINSDLENVGIGMTTYSLAIIRFARRLRKEEKQQLEVLGQKYGVAGDDFELHDQEMMFLMDRLVWLGDDRHDMSRLASLLRDINALVEIQKLSTGMTFCLRRLSL